MHLRSLVPLGIVSLSLVACSSSNDSKPAARKPAVGAAKATTTKAPSNAPKPTASTAKKSGSGVTSNKDFSAPTQLTCEESEEGRGLCDGKYVVFCGSDQKVYALDCVVAFGENATCAEINGEVDCVVEE